MEQLIHLVFFFILIYAFSRYILLKIFFENFIFLFSSKYHFDSVLITASFCIMSNKRNRAVLEEDDYVVDEYEYPSDSAYDEEPTQVVDNNSFYLRGEIFFFFPCMDSQRMMALHQWLLVLPVLRQLYLPIFLCERSLRFHRWS